MSINPEYLKTLVSEELASLYDERVLRQIRSLLQEPTPLMLQWDYGPPNTHYPCWIVMAEHETGFGIAYCQQGFGPRCPWGLVSLTEGSSMGMDSGWFRHLLDAYFESSIVTELPIWHVVKWDPARKAPPLSEECDWPEAWRRVEELRRSDPSTNYSVDHRIPYCEAHTAREI